MFKERLLEEEDSWVLSMSRSPLGLLYIYYIHVAGWLLTSIFFIRRLLLCSLYYSRFARLNSVLTYSPKTHLGKKRNKKEKVVFEHNEDRR